MTGYGESQYGAGEYGGVIGANPLNLHVKSRTSTVVTLEWSPQSVDGYLLNKNGSVISSSWDGTKTIWRASYKSGDKFEVVPLKRQASSTIQV